MANIVVNIATLKQCCENNEKHTLKLMEQKDLLEEVAYDLYGKWEGGASRGYFNRFSVKQEKLDEVIKGLADVINFEHRAIEVYTEANKIASEMIDEMY